MKTGRERTGERIEKEKAAHQIVVVIVTQEVQ